MNIRIINIVSMLMLTSSCALPLNNIKNNYQLSNKNGVILMSLTASGECGYAIFTEINEIGTNKNYSIGMQEFGSQRDWKKSYSQCPSSINDYYGRLVSIELPEGIYQVVHLSGITANRHIYSKGKFSVKFSVKAGKINYLGNIHFHIKKKNFSFSIKDIGKRDINLFLDKYKQFGDQDIIKNLFRMKQWGSSITKHT